MAVLYLKKKSDIDLEGNYNYSSSCFLLDDNVFNVDLDTPQKKIETRKKIGNGQYVRVTDFFDNRTITISLRFKRDNAAGENVFSSARLEYLKKWVTTDDETYLIRYYSNSRLEYIRVYPAGISGEKYSNYQISGEISTSLITDIPFFQNTLATEYNFVSTGGEKLCLIENGGVKCPFSIAITLDADTDGIILRLFENIQLQLTNYFFAGDVVFVNMANMFTSINGVEQILQTTGSPFSLVSGENNLIVRTDLGATIDISFLERFL